MPIPIFVILLLAARMVWTAMRDPVVGRLGLVVIAVLTLGTISFHEIEEWGWLDSLYFSVITLCTVGFGDFTPQTTLGKWMTILYIFLGLGFLLAFATAIAQRSRAWLRVYEKGTGSGDASDLPPWARH